MILCIYFKDNGAIAALMEDGVIGDGRVFTHNSSVTLSERTVIEELPDQDLSLLYDEEGHIIGMFPDSVVRYSSDEKKLLIDRSTGESISNLIHPMCGRDEEAGVHRSQIVSILNALGIEPNEDFAVYNEIAAAEIKKARIEKEALTNA